MLRGKYIGPLAHLKDATALLQVQVISGTLRAQFDDVKLFRTAERPEGWREEQDPEKAGALGYGWHAFDMADFEMIRPLDGES